MSKKGNANVDNFEITVNKDLISDNEEITNVFNEYFLSIPSKLKLNRLTLNYFKVLLILE